MKILLVAGRYPKPAVSGDRRRTAQFVEALARSHELTLLVPEPSTDEGTSLDFHGVRIESYRVSRRSTLSGLARCLIGGHPWQAGLFYQPALKRALGRLVSENDLVILQLARLVLHLEDTGPSALAVDFIDSLALNMETRARFEPFATRFFLRWEARRLRRWEARLLQRSVLSWVVCERDRRAMEGWVEPKDLLKLRVLLLGEAALNDGPLASPMGARAETLQIALTGNLGYFPMVDGARWWLREVWPRLEKTFPGLTVVLAGARPSRTLRRACRQAGARVRLEDSPEDLLSTLRASTVAIAPMRCGSGRPTKVLEAWACGVPVVAHPEAAAGLAAGYEKALELATTVAEWEGVLGRILRSPEERGRLGLKGLEFVRLRYRPEQAAGLLREQISQL